VAVLRDEIGVRLSDADAEALEAALTR